MKLIVPIDLTQTAEILGISKATVRNWIRHGYINPINSEGRFFNKKEVLDLKQAISRGELNRLKARANKSVADNTFLPAEYVSGQENKKAIVRVLSYIRDKKIEPRLAILILAVKQFIGNKDILSTNIREILSFSPNLFPRKNVCLELESLFDFLDSEYDAVSAVEKQEEDLLLLLSLPFPEIKDGLGLVYQSLINEGDKSRLGSYFTPAVIVDRMVRENIRPHHNVLDPCCGTGQFLLAFAEHLSNPLQIWGADIDQMAVHIARLNLLLKFPQDFKPRIYHLDTLRLLNDDQPKSTVKQQSLEEWTASMMQGVKFDLIATNPPWGAGIDLRTLNKLVKIYPQIISGESFSYFLRISLDLVKDGGVLSFVLPESILNIKTHRDIRQEILENSRIKNIEVLGKVFNKVLSPAVIMELIKAEPDDNHEVDIRMGKRVYKLPQKRFTVNEENIFDICLSSEDEDILKKVYSARHVTLKNNTQWALGIVTGDNKRYLTAEMQEGYEPIYKGSDVERFRLKKPSTYLRFTPAKFQQVAPEDRYSAKEKLIYKFISNRLIFAYDDKEYLTLNSANIMIPKLKGYPMKVIMALFNSTVYQFIYQKKFNTLKVLRGNLEQLPLPLWDKEVFTRITLLVDKIMGGEDLFDNLDAYIMEQFGFSQEEREYILHNVK